MTSEQKLILLARLKSLAWRVGMMATVYGVNWLSSNVGLFNLSPAVATLVGLALGEISKFLNSNLEEFTSY